MRIRTEVLVALHYDLKNPPSVNEHSTGMANRLRILL